MVLGYARNLALIAFATVSLRGILTDSDFQGTIQTALIAGTFFYVLGLIFGELGRRIVEESVEAEIVRQLAQEMESNS